MNPESSEIDPLLWSRAGGDLLTAVYGYVPSLHDARLIGVSLEGDAATLRFEYADLAEGAARTLGTRFELAFSSVHRMKMPLEEIWVIHAGLSNRGGLLRLDLQMTGGWLMVEAHHMEIRLLGVDVQNEGEPSILEWQPEV